MKKIFILFFVLSCHQIFSQEVDYDKIILPEKADSLSIPEKLVQLAWKNYPSNEALKLGVVSAKKDVTITKLDWTNKVTATFNANEYTIQDGIFKSNTGNAVNVVAPGLGTIPRYNFSVGLSLGDLITTPTKVSKSKTSVKIAESKVLSQKLTIRSEMLKRYQIYLTSIEILKLRVKAVEEAHLIHLLVTKL